MDVRNDGKYLSKQSASLPRTQRVSYYDLTFRTLHLCGKIPLGSFNQMLLFLLLLVCYLHTSNDDKDDDDDDNSNNNNNNNKAYMKRYAHFKICAV